jgi:hypothetical protein
VLVLPGVLCSTAYVAGEGGRSSPGRVSEEREVERHCS